MTRREADRVRYRRWLAACKDDASVTTVIAEWTHLWLLRLIWKKKSSIQSQESHLWKIIIAVQYKIGSTNSVLVNCQKFGNGEILVYSWEFGLEISYSNELLQIAKSFEYLSHYFISTITLQMSAVIIQNGTYLIPKRFLTFAALEFFWICMYSAMHEASHSLTKTLSCKKILGT